MRHALRGERARVGALLVCLAAALLLPGCALLHRGHSDVGCRNPYFAGNAQSLAPLKAPPGLNGPNTAGGVTIPRLDTPTPPRARNAPCLYWPPKYVPEVPTPPIRRTTPAPAAQ